MVTGTAAGLDERRVAEIDAYLEEHRRRRQGNKILHGYPPPLLWRQRPVPVAEVMAQRRRTAAAAPKRLILYVSTPYCLPTRPDRCGFCLFPSEAFRGRAQLDEYLGYLELEGRLYQGQFDGAALDGVYFGGGTANLYPPERYERLLGLVRGTLGPIPPAAEVTLEGIPQLFTRDKLAAMKAAGVNRISIGAQQLADDLIALSGRRQRSDQVFRAIEWCHELGLPASVDLIFGWPRQSVERMLEDLSAIVATGIAHLTHYELNVSGRSAFALERRDELPSREENLEMYRAARELLTSAGYRQRTAYDWEKTGGDLPAGYRFEESWHHPLRSGAAGETSGAEMWGWGFAGVSSYPGAPDAPGWTYLNHTRVESYFSCLDEGRFPVERGYRYGERDLRLNVLFQMLHGLSVDRGEYRRLFGVDLVAEHAEVWSALERRGWVEVDEERVVLTGDGVFHTPLVQTLLARSATGAGEAS